MRNSAVASAASLSTTTSAPSGPAGPMRSQTARGPLRANAMRRSCSVSMGAKKRAWPHSQWPPDSVGRARWSPLAWRPPTRWPRSLPLPPPSPIHTTTFPRQLSCLSFFIGPFFSLCVCVALAFALVKRCRCDCCCVPFCRCGVLAKAGEKRAQSGRTLSPNGH
ncbi:hypothetical protein TW95_gp1130 [Pandoravirus inopinatum]|uniref:Uncharacterized protein n=1 Tax=Pandoravirus inopinatum TaxID=1605721 RepID=A0A0B5J2R7_9VIRU|nr:hypothetical protein TW95_gp1130 [Pandoravirus inopinatum]AJF97864.1 hypothetical protein [Pandoravirus inopinatum]